jgi:hypothetical protein
MPAHPDAKWRSIEGGTMTYASDSDLPEVSDGMLQEALQRVRPYTIVVLKAGPNFSMPGPDRDAGVARTIWAHGKRNYALRLAGLMPIICPVADGSGVTGVCIFDTTPEEADRIMAGDPGVQAGVFTYEIHATHAFPGSNLPAPKAAVGGSGHE